MSIRDYSTTPASNNAAPPNGWPEGQAASTVNDCARQMMAEIRETGEELPYFDFGDDPTRIDNDTFTVAGDLTTRYPVGARVKLVGATTGFGRITVSSHSGGTTTIDVTMDSGNVPTSLVRVAVYSFHLDLDANPTGTVTLSATNGTSPLFTRADHGHALDQSIAPTMTGKWIYTFSGGGSGAAINISAAAPTISLNETDGAVDNRLWDLTCSSEQLLLRTVNDASGSVATIMAVDRTGIQVDRVTFPTTANLTSPFYVGQTAVGTVGTTVSCFHTDTASNTAASFYSPTAATRTVYISNGATAGNNVFIEFYTEGLISTLRGSISYNRAGGLVAYNTTSDERLKDNIRDSTSALALIANIRIRAFDWKNMPGSAQRYWLVAQELFSVMPEAVSVPENDEDSWSLDASKLVPLAIKGMQEQQAQIQALTARVAALEAGRVGVTGK